MVNIRIDVELDDLDREFRVLVDGATEARGHFNGFGLPEVEEVGCLADVETVLALVEVAQQC